MSTMNGSRPPRLVRSAIAACARLDPSSPPAGRVRRTRSSRVLTALGAGALGVSALTSALACKSQTAGNGNASATEGGATKTSGAGAPRAVRSFSAYKPEGCPYEVSFPTGVEGMLGQDVGTSAPDHVHTSFVGPSDSSFAVNWHTNDATLSSTLLYGSDESAVQAAKAAGEGVRAQLGHTARYPAAHGVTSRIHEAHVCGLEAGKRYFYKVGGAGGWSPVYAVTTGPAVGSTQSFRFAVFGDARDDPGVFAQILEQAADQGAELALFTGDAVRAGTDQTQWNALFEARGKKGGIEGVLAGLPLMVSNGNHEALALNYLLQFAVPQREGRGASNEEWYSLDFGNAHIVVLNDTTADAATLSAERDFLDKDLAAVDRKKTPWLFAMHHRALYSCSHHGSDKKLRNLWQPIYDKHRIDAVFNGHDHDYERSKPIRGLADNGDGVVVDGGPDGAPVDNNGTIYVVAGGAGAPLYPAERCYHTQVSESVQSYVLVEVSGQKLSWKAYRLDGTVLDAWSTSK